MPRPACSLAAVPAALSALGFRVPSDGEPAAAAWAAALQGNDVAAEASPLAHVEALLPPILAKLACNPSLRLLVLAPSAAVGRLQEELALRGKAVGISSVLGSAAGEIARWPGEAHCAVGNPAALLPHFEHQDLSTGFHGNLLLAFLWADELLMEEEVLLRRILMFLPQPLQVSMVVTEWTHAAGQLGSQILAQPTFAQLFPQGQACMEDPNATASSQTILQADSQKTKDPPSKSLCSSALSELQTEDARMLAKYMANIVCRSSNADFQETVLELLPENTELSPETKKRKGEPVELDISTSQVRGDKDKQHQVVQDGITALLLASARSTKQNGGKHTARVSRQENERLAPLSDGESSEDL